MNGFEERVINEIGIWQILLSGQETLNERASELMVSLTISRLHYSNKKR